MLHLLITFLVCFGAVWSRDPTKPFKSMPAISNSLVNLGKMDISFHFNTKFPDFPPMPEIKVDPMVHPSSSFLFSKAEPAQELDPCPCSNFRNFKSPFVTYPTEIINKILMSNELFNYNKEPLTSVTCCDSHEHVQEDTVFFEFGPKQSQMDGNSLQPASLPGFPFMLDNFLPNKASLSPAQMKPKAIEIFFFPKKKEMSPAVFDNTKMFPKKKEVVKKSDIQIVGDKEIRNDFKSFKFRPSVPITMNSVKKNLTPENFEKETTPERTDEPTKVTVTISQQNTV